MLKQDRNIYLKPKKAGGMKITFQTPPKNGLDEKMLYNILRDYKILNCEVLVRDENGMYRELSNFIICANIGQSLSMTLSM
jgi:ribosome-interacting GTPase 1